MKRYFLLCVGLLVPAVCFSQLNGEYFFTPLPQGYKIGFQERNKVAQIMEMVPNPESVNNWTEMVTVQTFFGSKNSLAQFQDYMKKSWLAVCKGGDVRPLKNGEENGYPFALWVQSCPSNPATGKPENTYFKAVQGNNSLYVAQKASKFDLSKEQIVQWMHYLRSLSVCDTRSPDHPCPVIEKPSQ